MGRDTQCEQLPAIRGITLPDGPERNTGPLEALFQVQKLFGRGLQNDGVRARWMRLRGALACRVDYLGC